MNKVPSLARARLQLIGEDHPDGSSALALPSGGLMIFDNQLV
ncbi:hypothetical protein [Salipaludibacillus aurantiacus]|nr:hypothetical protein [Salipaludibacillus aurantiacus]